MQTHSKHPQGLTVVASFAIFIVIAAVAFGAFMILDYYQQTPVTNTNTSQQDPADAFAPVATQLAKQSNLKRFENKQELTAFLEAHAASQTPSYRAFGLAEDMAIGAPLAAEGSASNEIKTESSSAPDYSETNIQVQGVDEGDIVKTDGQYIYTVVGQSLYIVEAGAEGGIEEMSKTDFDFVPQGLYVNNDTLVVYSSSYSYVDGLEIGDAVRSSLPSTLVYQYDISDRAQPKKTRDFRFEGTYVSSRMIGQYVYVITSAYPYVYLDDPLPAIFEDGAALPSDFSTRDVFYVDVPYESYTFTSVASIPLTGANAQVTSDVYLVNSTENVYMSENALYLTYTKYISDAQIRLEALRSVVEPQLAASEKQKIKDIEEAPAHILSVSEKQYKISSLFEEYMASLDQSARASVEDDIESYVENLYEDVSKELEKTVIQKITVSNGQMSQATTGEVTGHVLNQFSMDEQDGFLRVATTKGNTWSQFEAFTSDSYNNLYILDGDMKVVGKVENLAKGERIYSVRFMQNRAYVVTFKQVDPLFAIDVSDPKNPEVLGELKVPGFSSYLHPYDDTRLIGIGKQADENGRTKGLKISLFNVADPANLSEVATVEIGDAGSDSIALSDHKAFLFSKDKNLLVVPMTVRESEDGVSYGDVTSNGAEVFTVTADSLTRRGTISHQSESESTSSEYDPFFGYSYYRSSVKRSLYIENNLYTVSEKELKSNNLGTLADIDSFTFNQ